MFAVFEDAGGELEIALLALMALGLENAKLLKRLLELAGEALAVHAERGEGLDQLLATGGFVEEAGFEDADAVLAPSEVRELMDQLRFGGVGGAGAVEFRALFAGFRARASGRLGSCGEDMG